MTNGSSEWILLNLGAFSQFATVQEIYQLYAEFNAVSTEDQKVIPDIIVSRSVLHPSAYFPSC